MKKIIFIALILFIFTGCSVRYELKIDETSKMFETITINGKTSDFGLSNINKITDFYLKDKTQYEVTSKNVVDDNYNIKIKSSLGEYKSYQTSSIVSNLYNLFVTTKNNTMTYRYIPLEKYNQDEFNLNIVDPLIISLRSDLKVIDSNAKTVNENEYIWNIDNELEEITFTIDISEVEDDKDDTITNFLEDNNIKPMYIELGLLLIVAIVVITIFVKYKKGNRI